ncbi:MAG: transaldolase [Lentisphaeria bacterium]|nr:transaldolase [Lentisphaeria bacterium]
MFLLIDTANIDVIAKAMESFPLAGVTTCPTIIVREKRPLWDILKDIRSLIGNERMLHAQVMGSTAEEILKDAVALRSHVDGNFFVKVPVTLEGFRAMPMLRREGIAFTATTIHSASQAILAAEHGASFLAPYINHIEDANESGAALVRQVVDYLASRHLDSKLLAASFRNVHQIMDVLSAGAHTVTLDPPLLWKMAEHPQTDASVAKFRAAWSGFYGEEKNVSNL